MDYSGLTGFAANSIYGLQALLALWGAFCVIVVWRRLAAGRFRNDEQQDDFLAEVEGPLLEGNLEGVGEKCAEDPRALPQLVLLAMANRDLGYGKVRQLLAERFQRDVMSDLDHRMTWVYTVIKTAPMLGLLGTVLGMMAAFGKLAGEQSKQNLDPTNLAGDISTALLTTFVGLAIAVPLSLCAASIQIRMRRLEEQIAEGLTHFLEIFRPLVRE